MEVVQVDDDQKHSLLSQQDQQTTNDTHNQIIDMEVVQPTPVKTPLWKTIWEEVK